MYLVDSWGLVSLPASDVQAIVETLQDAIEQLTSRSANADLDAIADQLAMVLDLTLGEY